MVPNFEEFTMENTQKKSDFVLARRNLNAQAVDEVVEGMTKKMTRVELSRAVDEHLGRVGDGVTWNDTGVRIAQLLKDGKLQEVKEEGKKRTFYMKTIAE
jgi:hypothetical protein